MGWRGRGRDWRGPWPGKGPFSYLPPWQRPGWLYGRGACWWLAAPYLQATVPTTTPGPPIMPAFTTEQEKQALEQHMKYLQTQLDAIRKRLEELSSGETGRATETELDKR